MTPAARVAAAISVLDDILGGRSAEQALSSWARSSRFAGSKDRAALRDLVFDALRRQSSCAAVGGGLHGRGLMIGLGRQHEWDMDTIFSGTQYAPDALSAAERDRCSSPPVLSDAALLDLQPWQWELLQRDLRDEARQTAEALRDRAPLFLRVNLRRTSVSDAIVALADDQVTAVPHAKSDSCLQVTDNERRVKRSRAYANGLIEVQDASSQMAVARLDIPTGARVLDYCAGGGGKALAIKDRFDCHVTAHDINRRRTQDIGPRAARAGCTIQIAESSYLPTLPLFDVVLVDAPCSGSGTWRRNPEAKWALTPEKLSDFAALQCKVLSDAVTYLRPKGTLIYMTCSVFYDENQHVVKRFCDGHDVVPDGSALSLLPSAHHDGFFCQRLKRG